MPKILLDNGYLIVSIRHLLTKPDGSLYYQRRIPRDLKGHYSNKNRILESLKTRDLAKAARRIAVLAKRDDRHFAALRCKPGDQIPNGEAREAALALLKTWGKEPGEGTNIAEWFDEPHEDYLTAKYGDEFLRLAHDPTIEPIIAKHELDKLLSPIDKEAVSLLFDSPEKRQLRVRLSDALNVYLETHPKGNQRKFSQGTRLAIKIVLDTVGDLPLESYTREIARKVRDAIPGSTGTKRRRLAAIVAVFNKGVLEFSLTITNPFHRIEIQDEGGDAEERVPFTLSELETIAAACRERNDDLRWIAALQMDTGARLGEVVGLRVEDVFLTDPVPYIWIRPNKALGRSIKTDNSNRKVPLVGMTLWASEAALAAAKEASSDWLFPRYSSAMEIKATTASNSLNKWLRRATATDKTTHCFRHSMLDRLRTAEVPESIQKAIVGHGRLSITDGYGQGYPLEILRSHLERTLNADSV